ncbi:proton-conducting transporter membrane subunit [Roseospira goensis]|uniref:Multicomponent Na+:H+ antiporter subunit D n=1 Tax=Roseospira goensis TaxID=391922 RepID=A0A7W6RWL5_9PROT|nr:proton-conducting transporter membrane subunit [Roseospira goensis]MBB4284426.1 multicomponent Na+:H+ antiporter subunit D [Roseospira goensis]
MIPPLLDPAATIAAALLVPFTGTLLVLLCGRWPNLREAVSLVTALGLTALVYSLLGPVLAGARPTLTLWEVIPGVPLAFTVEPLGLIFAMIASLLWIVTTIYSVGYMRGNQEHAQTRFYACFAVAILSAIGIAFSGNLLTLFLFYELLTISTVPLVTHTGTDEARRSGRVYLGLLMGTSIGLQLVAIIGCWVLAGHLDFVPGGLLAGHAEGWPVLILLALFVFGIGKAAVMPFHRWLPAAMVAPTPVSALLHAVAVVKAGVFTVVKVVVYVFGLDLLTATPGVSWIAALAGFTILSASFVALRQDNLKRRLAYSTISQLSYVVLAALILAPLSVMGAALHIMAHAFGKITLFFAAGSLYTAAHKTHVSQLDGIGWTMPWTMGAFAIGSLSMIGLPPTAGFVSKWFMLGGAYQAEAWAAMAVILASTVLNAAYFLPIVYRAFATRPAPAADPAQAHGEAPWPIVLALTLTAAGSLVLFLAPDAFLALAAQLVGGAP